MSSKNFIRAIEVWVPNRSRTKLNLHTGHYRDMDHFERISRGMSFTYDEGLPGKSWANGHPIVLKNLQNSYFKRGDAAVNEGLDCAVAVPTFIGPDLKSVLVFLCGHEGHRVGALEIWHAAPGEPQMKLNEGYFGVAEKFEFVSRHTQFAPKVGLPGIVWDSGLPYIMDDLGRSSQFLRSGSAEKVGISRGVGIPCQSRPGNGDWVLTFLSACNSPIADRFEVWIPDEAASMFRFVGGYCETGADLRKIHADGVLPLDAGPLAEARTDGIPVLTSSSTLLGVQDEAVAEAILLVLPIFRQASFSACLAAYL